MQVIHYTDPGCPYAFSAEPTRLLLDWHYGDQLEWRTVLIVLSSTVEQLEAKGFTPAKLAAYWSKLQREHGMPISGAERERLGVTRPACLAIAAARLHQPDAADALRRRRRAGATPAGRGGRAGGGGSPPPPPPTRCCGACACT